MPTLVFPALLCIVISFLPSQSVQTAKRILLNDPDILAARLANLEAKVNSLEAGNLAQVKVIAQLSQTSNTNQGSTFTRWGRTTCPTSTEKVYSGFAAGQEHYYSGGHNGGPSNTLCLPSDPELSNRTAPGASRIYGTEYQGTHFSKEHDQDVPCAICRSNSTTSSIMIPGRRSCYAGWKKEYDGIIASGSYDYKASDYLCLDSQHEYVPGGERNSDGHLLYATTLNCGSLSCPPYHSGFELLCVVCSK